MPTLMEVVEQQRAAALAHRLRLGLGIYCAEFGAQVLYDVPVEWRDSKGRKRSDDCATVRVNGYTALIFVSNSDGTGIVRRLGCSGLKIDGK